MILTTQATLRCCSTDLNVSICSTNFDIISTQLTLTLIYFPPTLSFPIQPTSTSAVAIILPSASPSPIEKPPKKITKPRDVRLKSTEKYEILFPDFYYSASKNWWICKICSSFATRKGDLTFLERPVNMGDHPTEHFTDHLKTKGHNLNILKWAYSLIIDENTRS